MRDYFANHINLTKLAGKKEIEKIEDFGFELPSLPYSYTALEPVIDSTTMRIHHTKHHQKYVDKMVEVLDAKKSLKNKTLVELLKDLDSIPVKSREQFKDNAGGHFNHSFFWVTMSPETNQEPQGRLKEDIDKEFGSFQKFKEEFIDNGLKQFGSGWVWMCLNNDNKLMISGMPNQMNPYIAGCGTPLLGCDVWEHAYYLKYQNNREKYLTNWFKVINWKLVSKNYEEIKK
jgi:Fe-Mn family superoxide dismutase